MNYPDSDNRKKKNKCCYTTIKLYSLYINYKHDYR